VKNLTLTECTFIAGGTNEEEVLVLNDNNDNAVTDALESLESDSNNLEEMLSDSGE